MKYWDQNKRVRQLYMQRRIRVEEESEKVNFEVNVIPNKKKV